MWTNNEAFEELKNTAKFSMIQDTTLKNSINRYYAQSDWYFNSVRKSVALEQIEKWKDYIIVQHGFLTEDIGNTVGWDVLLNDPLTLLYLRDISHTAGHRAESAGLMKREAWKLIELLNDRISQSSQ
jgi:hypothetical protein